MERLRRILTADDQRYPALRYKVDLKRFMSDCETNYYRLGKLLSVIDESGSFQLALPGERGDLMVLEVLERTPYTSLVEIRQQVPAAPSPWMPETCLKVRMYHDARLAEVVNCGGKRNPRPRYPYPNEDMLQPDEKAQWNQFLSEWLALAIGHGFSVAAPCEFAG